MRGQAANRPVQGVHEARSGYGDPLAGRSIVKQVRPSWRYMAVALQLRHSSTSNSARIASHAACSRR